MNAGEQNKLLAIWNPSLEEAGAGNQTAITEKVGDIWAAVEDLSSNERFQLGTIGFAVSHRIKCRYTTLIKSTTILKMGDRELHVVSIRNPESRNRELEVMAQEETADA
jgi:SPP1 family predicted phage head-tail adaptor